jgi:hypothetical protein
MLPQKDELLELLIKSDNYAKMITAKRKPYTQWDDKKQNQKNS